MGTLTKDWMLGMMPCSQVLRPIATFSWMKVDQVWTIFSGGQGRGPKYTLLICLYLISLITTIPLKIIFISKIVGILLTEKINNYSNYLTKLRNSLLALSWAMIPSDMRRFLRQDFQ